MKISKIRGHNTSGYVQANGEVLFAPGTDVSRWLNTLSNLVTAETVKAAPIHGGPTSVWGAHRSLRPHPYAKRLKQTIGSKSRKRITAGGGYYFAVVGSSAPYATFVDQGTKPYDAVLLPPWSVGSPTLYEASWKPSPGGMPVGPIRVRGQRAQNFFAKGLTDGMHRAGLVSGVSVSPRANAAGVLKAVPTTLIDLAIASEHQPYAPSIEVWRKWKEESWKNHRDFITGRAHHSMADRLRAVAVQDRKNRRRKAYKAREAERSRRNRAKIRAMKLKSDKPKPQRSTAAGRAAEKARFLMAMNRKYPYVDTNSVEYRTVDGKHYWYVVVGEYVEGRNGFFYKETRGRSVY